MTPSIPGGAEIQHLMKSSLIFLAIEGIVKSFLKFLSQEMENKYIYMLVPYLRYDLKWIVLHFFFQGL